MQNQDTKKQIIQYKKISDIMSYLIKIITLRDKLLI